MGLDMYLQRRTYVKQWDHDKPEYKFSITVKKGGKVYKAINPKKINYIIEEAGYWRKANAIHKWFEDNVVKNTDWNGDEAYVSREDLEKLLQTVNHVLAASKLVKGKIQNGSRGTANGMEPIIEDGETIEDHTVAEKYLPTESGFFFGSTDYDQYYYEDLKDTKKIIEDALAVEGGELYYSASW